MRVLLIRINRWPLILKLLYLLIVFDGVATYCGLKLGVIREGNPLMARGFDSYPLLTLIIKMAFSLIFLEVINYGINCKSLVWPARVVPILLLVHIIIAFLHLYWIGCCCFQ